MSRLTTLVNQAKKLHENWKLLNELESKIRECTKEILKAEITDDDYRYSNTVHLLELAKDSLERKIYEEILK